MVLNTDLTDDFILALAFAVHAGLADAENGVPLHAHPNGYHGASHVVQRLNLPVEYTDIDTRGCHRKALASAYNAAHFSFGKSWLDDDQRLY